MSVDVVNIIDQNHASAILPTGNVPVVPVDEVAKLASEPVWELPRRAKYFPMPDSERNSFLGVVCPYSQRGNVT